MSMDKWTKRHFKDKEGNEWVEKYSYHRVMYLSDANVNRLNALVNCWLHSGWEPLGGLIINKDKYIQTIYWASDRQRPVIPDLKDMSKCEVEFRLVDDAP